MNSLSSSSAAFRVGGRIIKLGLQTYCQRFCQAWACLPYCRWTLNLRLALSLLVTKEIQERTCLVYDSEYVLRLDVSATAHHLEIVHQTMTTTRLELECVELPVCFFFSFLFLNVLTIICRSLLMRLPLSPPRQTPPSAWMWSRTWCARRTLCAYGIRWINLVRYVRNIDSMLYYV